jgi:hypothetical protein
MSKTWFDCRCCGRTYPFLDSSAPTPEDFCSLACERPYLAQESSTRLIEHRGSVPPVPEDSGTSSAGKVCTASGTLGGALPVDLSNATMPIPFRLRCGRPRRNLDAKTVIMLRAQGLSWREIGKKLGVGTGTAFRAAQGRSKTVP